MQLTRYHGLLQKHQRHDLVALVWSSAMVWRGTYVVLLERLKHITRSFVTSR